MRAALPGPVRSPVAGLITGPTPAATPPPVPTPVLLQTLLKKMGDFEAENRKLRSSQVTLEKKLEAMQQELLGLRLQALEPLQVKMGSPRAPPPQQQASSPMKIDTKQEWSTVVNRRRRQVKKPRNQAPHQLPQRPPVPLRAKVSAPRGENLKILEKEVCRQFGLDGLDDLRGVRLLTLDRKPLAAKTVRVIRNHHGVYAEVRKVDLAEHENRGASAKKYYNRLYIKNGGPMVYEQLRNTEARNCPPGALACWDNKGYAAYKPGMCYVDLLRCSVQRSNNQILTLDRRPIQKQLRQLDCYVGAMSWPRHHRRAAALRRQFRQSDFRK